jgi:hypothetical protein
LKDESTYKYCYREDQIESTKGEKPHKINIIIAKKTPASDESLCGVVRVPSLGSQAYESRTPTL